MKIRFASASEAAACNQFYNDGHQKRRSVSQWEWEFISRDFPGPNPCYVIAEDEWKIVGSQALIPIKVIDESGIYWTAKSEETLLNPAYRGRQIFEKMYDLLKETAVSSGIRNIWGFTPATKAFTRIGFETPGKTAQIFFPLSGRAIPVLLAKQQSTGEPGAPSPLRNAVYRAGGAAAGFVSSTKFVLGASAPAVQRQRDDRSGFQIRLLTSAPAEAGDLCREFIRQFGGRTVYRDTAYLQWRLFDNPYVKALVYGAFVDGRLCGWTAFALGDDGMGYMVDIMAVNCDKPQCGATELVRGLLSTAVRELRKMGALGIRGWNVNGHRFDNLVLHESKRLGFWHVKRGHDVVILHLTNAETKNQAIPFADWYVTRIYTEGLLG